MKEMKFSSYCAVVGADEETGAAVALPVAATLVAAKQNHEIIVEFTISSFISVCVIVGSLSFFRISYTRGNKYASECIKIRLFVIGVRWKLLEVDTSLKHRTTSLK